MHNNLDKWRGEFGDNYLNRNPIDQDNIKARMTVLSGIMQGVYHTYERLPNSILEIGCGNGANLLALDNIFKTAPGGIIAPKLYGIEPNKKAREEAKLVVPNANITNGNLFQTNLIETVDLVFTCGVLIHVPPEELLAAMKNVYDSSNAYILCMEYFAPTCEPIIYQGQDNMLWRNDFGSIYMDNFKLQCVGWGFIWKRMINLDNLTWWLFRKVN